MPCHADFPMVETIVEMATYMGMSIKPCAYLDHGAWTFDDERNVIVAHDLWERLQRPISEVELLTDYVEE